MDTDADTCTAAPYDVAGPRASDPWLHTPAAGILFVTRLCCDDFTDKSKATVSVNGRILEDVPIRLKVPILDFRLRGSDRWELESILNLKPKKKKIKDIVLKIRP